MRLISKLNGIFLCSYVKSHVALNRLWMTILSLRAFQDFRWDGTFITDHKMMRSNDDVKWHQMVKSNDIKWWGQLTSNDQVKWHQMMKSNDIKWYLKSNDEVKRHQMIRSNDIKWRSNDEVKCHQMIVNWHQIISDERFPD